MSQIVEPGVCPDCGELETVVEFECGTCGRVAAVDFRDSPPTPAVTVRCKECGADTRHVLPVPLARRQAFLNAILVPRDSTWTWDGQTWLVSHPDGPIG